MLAKRWLSRTRKAREDRMRKMRGLTERTSFNDVKRNCNMIGFDDTETDPHALKYSQPKRKFWRKEKACLCLSSKSRFRRFCKWLTGNLWFNNVILVLIIASSALFVFEDQNLIFRPSIADLLALLDLIFFGIFSAEFTLRVLGNGLIFTPTVSSISDWQTYFPW